MFSNIFFYQSSQISPKSPIWLLSAKMAIYHQFGEFFMLGFLTHNIQLHLSQIWVSGYLWASPGMPDRSRKKCENCNCQRDSTVSCGAKSQSNEKLLSFLGRCIYKTLAYLFEFRNLEYTFLSIKLEWTFFSRGKRQFLNSVTPSLEITRSLHISHLNKGCTYPFTML